MTATFESGCAKDSTILATPSDVAGAENKSLGSSRTISISFSGDKSSIES